MYQNTQQVELHLGFNDAQENKAPKQGAGGRYRKLSHRLLHAKYLLLQARHLRRNMLLTLHSLSFDRGFERLLFIPTKGAAREIELQFNPSDDIEDSNTDQVPVKSVKWALDILKEDDAAGVFVDRAAGRGQRLLIAAAKPFDKIIGIEHSESLRDDANMNIAQFPRSYMRCRQVECVDVEDDDMLVPTGQAVFFFHKPRHMGDFQAQINRIADEYKKDPRRFHILTLGASPQINDIILQSGIFERAPYSNLARIKHRLFSPYRIKAYRTFV